MHYLNQKIDPRRKVLCINQANQRVMRKYNIHKAMLYIKMCVYKSNCFITSDKSQP